MKQPDEVQDLLRSYGKESIFSLAESAGLKVGQRIRCPFDGCRDQGEKRKANLAVFAAKGGIFRVHCHRCDSGGTYLDVLMAIRQLTAKEAIAELKGMASSSPPKPSLRLVHHPRPIEQDKLQPAEVGRVWKALDTEDPNGQLYLESRGLGDAIGTGMVRFATEKHPEKQVQRHAHHGRRVAMLLTDVVGNPRGIQFRLARDAMSRETKMMSLKGSSMSAFFGSPELIEGAPIIGVAEGMADTLALASWAGKKLVVVGAAGKGNLAKLADELKAAGIVLEGKVFALFPQNDRPKNESRREFVRLSQLISAAGAQAVLVPTDEEFKDLADWRRSHPEVPWPPPQLAKAIGAEDTDEETSPETKMVVPPGSVVPIPQLFRTDRYAQDFTTLCSLLDDPVHREAIMGRGDLTLSEMTERPLYAGKEIKDSDIAAIRFGLESQGRTMDGKPLKFRGEDVWQSLLLLASRRRFHPVREWLSSLRWDGRQRIDEQLPACLGHECGSLEGTLLRKWLISAVARAMKPGCKVDTVLVLAGPQGRKKSSFFAAIGGDWFSDEPVNVDDKDGKLLMRRAWIVEWAELDSMRRARDQEAIKAFLSQRIDRFRPPYGRDLVEAPRGCVIVGTSNPTEFLHDSTGNRRFWPVKVKQIDLTWLEMNREQLLAEAVQAYRDGEQWWLEDEIERFLEEHNREYEASDAWESLIATFLDTRKDDEEVTTSTLLEAAVKKPAGQWGRADEIRCGVVMKRLGWERVRKRVAGTAIWIYEPLEKQAELEMGSMGSMGSGKER